MNNPRNEHHHAIIKEIRDLRQHIDLRLDKLLTSQINALLAKVNAAMQRLTGVAPSPLTKLKETPMAAFDDLKAATEAYIAAVDAAFADVNTKIQEAIAADDAAEDSALMALTDVVKAAQDKLAPVVPSTNP